MISNQLLLVFLVVILECSNASHDLYGKPCTKDPSPDEPNLVQCDLNHNMYCSEKQICECIIGERSRVFAYYDKKCIEVASPENGYACTKDIECRLSTYGKYSHCNMDMDKCECHDPNEKTVLMDNVCYVTKPAANTRFARGSSGLQGCSSNGDCQRSRLGELSRCNEATNTCECYDTRSNGKQDVAMYNGRCVVKKKLGEFCTDDDQCKAGHHKHAKCDVHPSFLPNERVCVCPSGSQCDDGSGAIPIHQQSFFVIAFSTVLMGVVAKVVG